MSTCNYCDAEVEWLEVAAGQRVPFDPAPEVGLGARQGPPPDGRAYVLMKGLVRLATDDDRRLLRTMRYRHRCVAYESRR
jgi:hypothetical protein